MSKMGYPTELFLNENIDDEFVCSICQDVFKNPIVLGPCEHAFCRDCIEEWVTVTSVGTTELQCPVDRSQVDKMSQPQRMFNNMLNNLEMVCPFKANGCGAVLKLEELEAHQEACEFRHGHRNQAVAVNYGFGLSSSSPSPAQAQLALAPALGPRRECRDGCGALLRSWTPQPAGLGNGNGNGPNGNGNGNPNHNCLDYIKEQLAASQRVQETQLSELNVLKAKLATAERKIEFKDQQLRNQGAEIARARTRIWEMEQQQQQQQQQQNGPPPPYHTRPRPSALPQAAAPLPQALLGVGFGFGGGASASLGLVPAWFTPQQSQPLTPYNWRPSQPLIHPPPGHGHGHGQGHGHGPPQFFNPFEGPMAGPNAAAVGLPRNQGTARAYEFGWALARRDGELGLGAGAGPGAGAARGNGGAGAGGPTRWPGMNNLNGPGPGTPSILGMAPPGPGPNRGP